MITVGRGRGRWRVGALLALPLTWLIVIYLLPLGLLFATAFASVDDFTGAVDWRFTLDNVTRLFTDPAYLRTTARTLGVAAAVTTLCAALAIPVSIFVARAVPARLRPLVIALLITPLWASYLVKVYAWRTMLNPGSGVVEWFLGGSPGFGWTAVVLTLTYLWLPYMILPVYVGISTIPESLLDASADLGAGAWRTFRSVVLPIIGPAVAAGSIFTFSLSLGDYITVQLVGGTSQMMGNVVYQSFSTNLPFAAAMAGLSVAIMIAYLLGMRRLGALDNL